LILKELLQLKLTHISIFIDNGLNPFFDFLFADLTLQAILVDFEFFEQYGPHLVEKEIRNRAHFLAL
jgi:hypothetical protein